jgi:serine/threonine protein phosphatase PrpC
MATQSCGNGGSGRLVLAVVPSLFTVAHALAFVRDPGEDRIAIVEREDALILVIADGAGGLSGGVRAAELLVELVRAAVDAPAFEPQRAETWVELLSRLDLALEADPDAGETTAVVMAIAEHGLTGASCGDSEAWLIGGDGATDDLTARQYRKLRVGSGRAMPMPFSRPKLEGTLLVATDGLFNYARPERIAEVARRENLDAAARELIRLVRLPSGGLQDDAVVVLVREGAG